MDKLEQSSLANTRVQGDLRQIKKLIKSFYRLFSNELIGEELQAAHEIFLLELEVLNLNLNKFKRLDQVTNLEIESYNLNIQEIEQTQTQTQSTISTLNLNLKEAQLNRSNRIEYDLINKQILNLPSRLEGEESNQKLTQDISTLTSQQSTYTQTMKTRQSTFDSIVSSLISMSDAIRFEKEEGDRRRALEDAEEGEGAEEEEGEEVKEGTESKLDPEAREFKMNVELEVVEELEEKEKERGEGKEEEEEEVEDADVEMEEGQELELALVGSVKGGEEKEEGEMVGVE